VFGVDQTGGVGDEEDSRPAVERSDRRSFNIPNPDGVAETLQVRANVVRGKAQDSRYVFSHHPTRSNRTDQARKLGPEKSAVLPPFLLTRHGERLAGETAVNDRDFPFSELMGQRLLCQAGHVAEDGDGRPVKSQDAAAEGLALAHGERAHPGLLRPEVHPPGQMPEKSDSAVISGIGHHLAIGLAS
jgi:hypothetical protein